MAEALEPRLKVQLRLALLADCDCEKTLAELEGAARGSGLSGAEIDAARTGRIFEARAAAAIAYACALRTGVTADVEAARARAERFGFSADDLAALSAEALSHQKKRAPR